MEVIGRHALFFDDDPSAAFVNSSEALVQWNSLSIDRYDVRHLITNPPASFRNLHLSSSPPPDSNLQSELDLERYADLPSSSDEPEIESEADANNAAAAAFHAVPFSYGNLGDSSEQKYLDLTAGTSVFQPPFPVPESLLQNLPPTEKLHQIIARTALFVSKHGGQSEIVLRVKQGDNPIFGFLMPHHHLHLYFRYLVDNPDLLKADDDGKSVDEKNHDRRNNEALSLLGSVYGSGEDEDTAAEVPRESEGIDSGELSAAGDMAKAHQLEQTVTWPQKDEIISKDPQSSKVKPTGFSRNRITSIKPIIANSVEKNIDVRGSTSPDIDKSKASGLFPITKSEASVVEPPPEVKRLTDRIVEIILKNGKDFEAVLVDQDKKHGKFPFLLPSSQYHLYYLKTLKKAQESRPSSKSYSSEKDVTSWQEMDKRSTSAKESNIPASDSVGPNELPLEYDDNDRKEKFKMVIGKSRKDSQDHPSRDTRQQSTVTVDATAAAAILQAATRGIRNHNLDIFINQGSSNEGGQASSLSLQSSKPQKKDKSGKSSVTVPAAKEIAKTAARAAAGEADSSEAGLTREQKLKAERLRRAKMFAAMIRSGVTPLGKEQPPLPPRGFSVDPPGSGVSGSTTNLVSAEPKEREGSSAAYETEHRSRKRRHYRSRKYDDSEGDEEEEDERKREKNEVYDEEKDEEEERKEHRKKRRSHRSSSSRHHRDRSKDRHKHRRNHSSKSKEITHRRHKHDGSSSSEEEDDDHHHRHKHHEISSSEDDHRDHKRRHKAGSRKDKERHVRKSSRKEEKSHSGELELEEGEIRIAKSRDRSPSITPSLPPHETATTEVPDDLRAKIRAMLLATM